MIVDGSDFYCGNSSGSPCQFALKNQIPPAYVHPATKVCNYSVDTSQFALKSEGLNKYSRCNLCRNGSGEIVYTDVNVGTVDVSCRGTTPYSKSFTFNYTAPYPIWYLVLTSNSKGVSYSRFGGDGWSGNINGITIKENNLTFYTDYTEFSTPQTDFTISLSFSFAGTRYDSEYSGQSDIIIRHNCYFES